MKKAVTYIRVSSKEQQDTGYSPEAQKRLLWTFARENGFDVAQEFEDTETAKEAGRKAFGAMLTYIRNEGVKHLLVEKTDRLHRNFSDFVKIEQLIKDCDITVHFVKEGNSIGKDAPSSQKFMYGVRTLMAKNFIDNLSEEVHKGFNEKLALGEYPGKAPVGYLNIQDPLTRKQTIIVDEKNRPLVLKLYNLYATGTHSLQSLIRTVEEMGLTTFLPSGRKLNKTTVAKLLQNPFYLGQFIWRGKTYKGLHSAIIDADLWQKAQDVLSGKNLNKAKPHNAIPFIFKGILTCGECQRTITAELKKGKYVYYRCTKYQRACSQQPVKEEVISKEVNPLLSVMNLSDDGFSYVVAALKKSLEEKRGFSDVAYQGMVLEKGKIKNRLDKMYEDRLDGRITEDYYDQKFVEYTDKMNKLDAEIAKHDRADINYYEFGLRTLELARNAEKLLHSATREEKQEFLHYLLSNSTLKAGMPDFRLKKPFFEIAKHSR